MDDPYTRATLSAGTKCMTKTRARENRRLDIGHAYIFIDRIVFRQRWSSSSFSSHSSRPDSDFEHLSRKAP